MSTKITFVAAALAALTLGLGAAQANTKGPSLPPPKPPHAGGAATSATSSQHHSYYRPHYYNSGHMKQKCYWLPTVSNGSLSGLEQKCIWVKN